MDSLHLLAILVGVWISGAPNLNSPLQRPPHPPGQGCGEEALVPINTGTKYFSRKGFLSKVPIYIEGMWTVFRGGHML